jgi:hypothetical protein
MNYNLRKMRYPLKFPIRVEYLVELKGGKVDAYGTPREMAPQARKAAKTLD